jgi:acetyl esterase
MPLGQELPMPLHPQAQAIVDAWIASGKVPPWELPREDPAGGGGGEPVHRVEDRAIPGPDGPIPVRIYWPSADTGLRLVAWFHGGGWVRGSIDSPQTDPTCRLIANGARAVVVSVGYRRAPEHRFPAAAEDCYAATTWAAEHAPDLGADAGRLAIGGSSAGGNLAAAVALMARDRGGPALRHQSLVYPITDHDFETASYRANADGYVLTRASMIWYWDQYVPGAADRDDPYVSVLKARSLKGLAPAHVITAEYDPLRDEGEAYAAELRAAGVPVSSTRYDGQIHGFFGRLGVLDDARRAVDEAVRRIVEDVP